MSIYQGLAKKSRWVKKTEGLELPRHDPPEGSVFWEYIVQSDMQIAYFWGMNGVDVARNEPRLWENEAAGSRKVFRWLWGLWDAI